MGFWNYLGLACLMRQVFGKKNTYVPPTSNIPLSSYSAKELHNRYDDLSKRIDDLEGRLADYDPYSEDYEDLCDEIEDFRDELEDLECERDFLDLDEYDD